jgi:hypothetical protein
MSEETHYDSISALHAELDALKAQVGRLTAQLATSDSRGEVNHQLTLVSEQRTDRRGLLKVAGAAAVGIAGAGILTAAPAGAQGTANGQAVQLGEGNTCTATTQVTTTIGDGLFGETSANGNNGVLGADISTGGGSGVLGLSTNGSGVYGQTSKGGQGGAAGVVGSDLSTGGGIGVRGQSTVGSGVSGVTTGDNSNGVIGNDDSVGGGFGVKGVSNNGVGVYAMTTGNSNNAVVAFDNGAVGGFGLNAGSSNGIGIFANGGVAPILLNPSATAGPPSIGTHQVGEIYVDSAGVFWGCVAGGTPGTWRSLIEQLIPVSPPQRAYDSRVTNSGPGPLLSGTTSAPISLTSAGVPASSRAALINLTVVNTTGNGYLTLFAAGGSKPATSNINWSQSGVILANNATPSLSAAGAVQVACGGSGGTDFIIDVFGYYP